MRKNLAPLWAAKDRRGESTKTLCLTRFLEAKLGEFYADAIVTCLWLDTVKQFSPTAGYVARCRRAPNFLARRIQAETVFFNV